MHLILTGATGLIGSAVLRNMLAMDEVTRISILSRSPVLMSELNKDKTNVIIHKDFNKYEAALLEELKDAEGCVWALGVSQLAVSKTYVHYSFKDTQFILFERPKLMYFLNK